MRSKRVYLDQGIVTKDTMWDYFVLSNIQKHLGGRVHTIVAGAAPIGQVFTQNFQALIGFENLIRAEN